MPRNLHALKIKRRSKIVIAIYSFVCGDLFHIGHLKLLQKAKQLGDFHICGVLTNSAVQSYKRKPIMNFEDRMQIIENLRCVDMVMAQDSRDPTQNLKKIHHDHPEWTIFVVHGDDWNEKEFPGKEYLESIGGKIILVPYYKPLSTTKLLQKIIERDRKGDLNI